MPPQADTAHLDDASPPVRQVPPTQVKRWIQRGWADFTGAGWPSLLHGVIVFVASIVIVEISLLYWPLLPGALSAFVLVGPILATGLYELSRRLEHRRATRVCDAVCAWRLGSKCLLRFGLLLILAGVAWVAMSLLLFSFFVDARIDEPRDFLRYVFVQKELHFLLWVVLGGLGAALMFGLTVVSVPLLLDRDVDTPTALRTSIRAVGENPLTMGLWAVFLLAATGLSVLTLMVGFIVLYPLMGHASWHVYRDLVDADGLVTRDRGD